MISTHIKTTLVDFDGTLIDSNGCWIEAYLLLCERKKQQPSVSTIDSFDKCIFGRYMDIFHGGIQFIKRMSGKIFLYMCIGDRLVFI